MNSIEEIQSITNDKIKRILVENKKMNSVSDNLVTFFFNNIDLCDQKLTQLLYLNTEECEQKYQEDPHLFDEYFLTTQVLETEKEYQEDPHLFDEYFLTTQVLENEKESDDSEKYEDPPLYDEYLHEIDEVSISETESDSVKSEEYLGSPHFYNEYFQKIDQDFEPETKSDSDSEKDFSKNNAFDTESSMMTQSLMAVIPQTIWEEEGQEHFCYNLQRFEHSLRNITNPNSIFISGFLRFKGFKRFRLHFYIDTGASMCIASKNVIPDDLWENAPREITATIANGEKIKINKVCRNLTLELSGEYFNIPTIYQQDSGMDCILGNNFIQLYGPFIQWIDRIAFHLDEVAVIIKKEPKALCVGNPQFLESMKKGSKIKQIPGTNIVKENINHIFLLEIEKKNHIEETLEKVCSENPIDPQKTKGWMKASIKLVNPNTVVRVKPMKYSPQDRVEFSKQIKELLEMNLIVESKSPHMSPAFLVENEAEKRRGKKRMVVNYKAINTATIGDSHNLPNMQELLTLLRGQNIFSTFDCKSGFWQVLLDEESQLLTAFTCPDGHYQWRVVPFGLKQAPSIFQRHMQNALRDLESFCTVYVDDIIVFSKNEREHYFHVLKVLNNISKYGIILSKKKANLFKTKINFLGLEVDQGTHCPQKHILEHLHNFPDVLEDKKQLQRFLGVLTYAEAYIEKLAKLRKPLQGKLKKDVIWNWIHSDTDYIKKIKKNLTIFPKLYLPSFEDKLIIETDASDEFWGGVLKAKTSENEEKICRFSSGSFKNAEKNYHSNEKELLAVKRVITKFSVYLTPVTFLVRTDNKNFTYFLRNNIAGDSKNGRQIRWQAWFSRYSFTVEHLSGEKNVLADCLTRDFQISKRHS